MKWEVKKPLSTNYDKFELDSLVFTSTKKIEKVLEYILHIHTMHSLLLPHSYVTIKKSVRKKIKQNKTRQTNEFLLCHVVDKWQDRPKEFFLSIIFPIHFCTDETQSYFACISRHISWQYGSFKYCFGCEINLQYISNK